MKFNLSTKSLIHDPNGFKDGYATLAHVSGTKLSYILLNTSSKSELISTSPSIAFPSYINELVTTFNSLLNLINSYYSTVFIDSSYLTGCFFDANSVSNGLGSLANKAEHLSLIIYSGLNPVPPTDLGNSDKAVSNKLFVSRIALEISALSCRPKISVFSFNGNSLM